VDGTGLAVAPISGHVMHPLRRSFVKVGSGELSTRGWAAGLR
jgi:hypothetical protein